MKALAEYEKKGGQQVSSTVYGSHMLGARLAYLAL